MAGGVTIAKSRPEYYMYEARKQLGKPLKLLDGAGGNDTLYGGSGNDVLQYWDTDDQTEVVLLYLESFGNPRKFGRIAQRLARQKPIVAVHRGGIDADRRRRGSEALFENSGVVQVDSIPELFDCATFFSYQPLPAGPRVAVIGNSTALGILATHTGIRAGLDVAQPVDLGDRASRACGDRARSSRKCAVDRAVSH